VHVSEFLLLSIFYEPKLSQDFELEVIISVDHESHQGLDVELLLLVVVDQLLDD